MESRKRPHSIEDEPTIQKKRILTSVNGTPHVNSVVSDADEPRDDENLELFRKEAIFRRMKHYSREHERSQVQIAQLEQRRSTCEAGMVAMAACWEQLVSAIRTLAHPEDLPASDDSTKGLFDLTQHISREEAPVLRSALEDNMQTTQKLITGFLQLGELKQHKSINDEAFKRCQRAQNECIALRSEITLVRNKLHDTEAQNKKYHEDLVAAEIRADRLRSGTVQAMQARSPPGTRESKSEEVEEPKSEAPASPPQLQVNGIAQLAAEQSGLQEVANFREEKIRELEHERALLRDEIHLLKINLKAPSSDFIITSPHYQILLAHASKLEQTINESAEELPRLRTELAKLQATRTEWQESVIAAADAAKEDLRLQIQRKEADNQRLRDQREQQTSELNERKHKESVKLLSLNELKASSASRAERIIVLESELKRNKTQLAANAGNADLMAFFMQESAEGVSYVDDLKKRVAAAEARAASFEQSLSRFDNDHPDIRQHVTAEAEARQQLADVAKQLEKYQSVYGDSSSLPPDVKQLSDELQRKEDEVQKLRLLDTQRGEAETSLYSELDKLSAAWEALDRQVKSKVFDLTSMEERLTKMGHDRAKSENKFYAAMRDKEAIETERKNITRNLEKQAKVIERLQESEKSLTQQVTNLEKEVVLWQRGTEEMKNKCTAVEHVGQDWKQRAEGERSRVFELRVHLKEQDAAVDAKGTELRRAEENLLRLRKEAEQQASKHKLLSTGTSSQKEAQLQKEIDGCMAILKCSTCKMQMRNTVITKCMHTFCRACVDARISTRQRKCPACNLGFASSDVQQVFFQ